MTRFAETSDLAGAAAASTTRRSAAELIAERAERRPHAIPAVEIPAFEPRGGLRRLAEAGYRLAEIVAALVGLVVSLPIMLLEALIIRLDSPGPVLFFQWRTARSSLARGRDLVARADLEPPPGGYHPEAWYLVPRQFRFVKFRTMYADARQRFPEWYTYDYDPAKFNDIIFKAEDDPRVTRVGKYLRRSTLDELPNLWCVLLGSMRLVGPRPEVPAVVKYYTPEQMRKFAVKPGITGLAQVNGRGLLTWGETIRWDLEYTEKRTIAGDLRIILLTAWYVVARRGAF